MMWTHFRTCAFLTFDRPTSLDIGREAVERALLLPVVELIIHPQLWSRAFMVRLGKSLYLLQYTELFTHFYTLTTGV